MELRSHDIVLEEARLRWDSHDLDRPETLHVDTDGMNIELQFRLSGISRTSSGEFQCTLREKENSIYHIGTFSADHTLTPGRDRTSSFLEVKLSRALFDSVWQHSTLDSSFQEAVGRQQNAWIGRMAATTPQMTMVLAAMQQCHYKGGMRQLYLEAKLTELMILQAAAFNKDRIVLKVADVERIYAVKEYIDLHYMQPCTILQLARQVGINQQKLKTGFKELFNTTVFTYLTDVRLQKAYRLLLEEKKYVGEVADSIGYRHPHHFTAAFKKKFGILPKELKK